MRYFYTDPLAASWMAKHFGMRLTTRSGAYSPTWDELASSGSFDGYFIHPDSLHLLEPIEGDVVWLIDEDGVTHVDVIDPQFPLGNQWHFDNGGKIVLRGGEPFFSPEQEGE